MNDAPMRALKGWLNNRFGIETHAGVTRLALATALILVVWAMSRWRKSQSYGLKPLLGLGFVVVVTLVGWQVYTDNERGPLWPLALATLGFLYLWGLAALIFDLVFVWHLYIHSSQGLRRMGRIMASPRACKEWEHMFVGKPK